MFDDAQKMIHMLSHDGTIQAHGVIGLFPAYAVNDDIIVLNETKSDVIATLFGLRQQVCYRHWHGPGIMMHGISLANSW